jgi:hypothetical protein
MLLGREPAFSVAGARREAVMEGVDVKPLSSPTRQAVVDPPHIMLWEDDGGQFRETPGRLPAPLAGPEQGHGATRGGTVRREVDALGEVLVPADALYGAQTQRAVENFPISGLRPRRAYIWSMGLIKAAAAQVNHRLGLLDSRRADAIIQAATEVMGGRWDASGDWTSCWAPWRA